MTETDDESQIRALLQSWSSAIQNGVMEGVLAHHANDIVMYDVPPPMQVRGIDAYRQAREFFFSHQPTGVFDLAELEVVASDTVAFCYAIVTCGPHEVESQFPMRLTIGLRKVAGDWVVTHEHHSVPAE